MVKRSFFNVGTICEKMMGVSKGVKSLGSGFPIGVSSIPIGTRFCLQSLVCYTFASSWRGKGVGGVLCGAAECGNNRFFAAVGQADFVTRVTSQTQDF